MWSTSAQLLRISMWRGRRRTSSTIPSRCPRTWQARAQDHMLPGLRCPPSTLAAAHLTSEIFRYGNAAFGRFGIGIPKSINDRGLRSSRANFLPQAGKRRQGRDQGRRTSISHTLTGRRHSGYDDNIFPGACASGGGRPAVGFPAAYCQRHSRDTFNNLTLNV